MIRFFTRHGKEINSYSNEILNMILETATGEYITLDPMDGKILNDIRYRMCGNYETLKEADIFTMVIKALDSTRLSPWRDEIYYFILKSGLQDWKIFFDKIKCTPKYKRFELSDGLMKDKFLEIYKDEILKKGEYRFFKFCDKKYIDELPLDQEIKDVLNLYSGNVTNTDKLLDLMYTGCRIDFYAPLIISNKYFNEKDIENISKYNSIREITKMFSIKSSLNLILSASFHSIVVSSYSEDAYKTVKILAYEYLKVINTNNYVTPLSYVPEWFTQAFREALIDYLNDRPKKFKLLIKNKILNDFTIGRNSEKNIVEEIARNSDNIKVKKEYLNYTI